MQVAFGVSTFAKTSFNYYPSMDKKALNSDLIQIIEKKIELAGIDYANEKYDEVEDELHEIEDAFIDTYGDELEEVISKVYKKISPKSDVMLPIAYIAKEYHKIDIESGVDYKPLDEEGVPVDIQGFEDQDTRLVFVPSPVRLLLVINSGTSKEVWKA